MIKHVGISWRTIYWGHYGKAAPCVNGYGAPVPCAVGRKKRESEAEAKPLVYAHGLYGYPYAYGYYGYPFGYYGK